MSAPSLVLAPNRPTPLLEAERVQLGHGSVGKMSGALIREHFLPHLTDPVLAELGDAAVVPLHGGDVASSTDILVVSPLELPGGNIGTPAVHGTLNDLATMGAEPGYLSAGFVLEEGLRLDLLERIVQGMARAAGAAGVALVTGDANVVERGKADGPFLILHTTGIGILAPGFRPGPTRAQAGDAILVSGPIGRPGIAIMAVREALGFEAAIESDGATLWPLVRRLRESLGDRVHVLRNSTRGGVASALNEIAVASHVGIELEETQLPIPLPVSAACAMLGLDPLYLAKEGILVAFLPGPEADTALHSLGGHALGREARVIGRVTGTHPGLVVLRTGLGGARIVDPLPRDQLPRIC